MTAATRDTLDRAKPISLLVLDCDGVLTDGRLYYGNSSQDGSETACFALAFNAQDGSSMKMLMRSGVEIAVISGRDSIALRRRLAELGIEHAFLNIRRKGHALAELTERLGLRPNNVAAMGDDLPDLSLFERAGLCIAPSDAHPLVRQKAHHITDAGGGRGCVREAVQVIMTAQDSLDSAIDQLNK